jgi:hypothetical protein
MTERCAVWRGGSDRPGDQARLDYEYACDGDVDLLGVTFDVPALALTGKRRLGSGPYRVYRNRLEGGVLDLHQVGYNDPVPEQSASRYRECRRRSTGGSCTAARAGVLVDIWLACYRIKTLSEDIAVSEKNPGDVSAH